MDRAGPLGMRIFVLSSAVLCGCAGTSPRGLGLETLSESMPAPGTATYDNYVPPAPQSSSSTTSPSPLIPSPVEPGFKGAFKRSAAKVSGFFTIEPKVIPADDAVSLASRPPPIGADVFLTAGKMLENRGDLRGAFGQYEKALQAEPRNLTALLSLARLHSRQSNFEQAEALYRRAIKFHPHNGLPLNDLGLCHFQNQKLDDAMAVLKRAVQLDPQRHLYRNNLAAVLVKAGQPAAAVDQLLAVQSEAVAHYNVGCLLYQFGAPEQAGRYIALALEKDPTLMPAQQMLARTGKPGLVAAPTAFHFTDSDRSADSPSVIRRSVLHTPHVPVRLPGAGFAAPSN